MSIRTALAITRGPLYPPIAHEVHQQDDGGAASEGQWNGEGGDIRADLSFCVRISCGQTTRHRYNMSAREHTTHDTPRVKNDDTYTTSDMS
jgi:hypothetical protein